MQTRPLGETGHESSVLTLGAFSLQFHDVPEATALVERALDVGVNHVDVAPSYGDAETKLAPALADHRDDLFLGCKTQERSRLGARAELEDSLDRLGVDSFDLYQFHAVSSSAEIDEILADDGAMAAFRAAKEEGLIDRIGLTSHSHPDVIREAVDRLDVETVMFPFNAVLAASDDPAHDYDGVLADARDAGLGTLGIKAFAKGPWPEALSDEERPYHTWYEPWDDPEMLGECLRYAAARGPDTMASLGDERLVEHVIDAARDLAPMSDEEADAFEARVAGRPSPVPPE